MPGSVSVGGEVYGDRDTHDRVLSIKTLLLKAQDYGSIKALLRSLGG